MRACPPPFVLAEDVRLPRLEFVIRFLARMTRRRRDRELVGGLRVRCRAGVWAVDYPDVGAGAGVLTQSKDPARIYDYVRRGELNYYVRQADELWATARGVG